MKFHTDRIFQNLKQLAYSLLKNLLTLLVENNLLVNLIVKILAVIRVDMERSHSLLILDMYYPFFMIKQNFKIAFNLVICRVDLLYETFSFPNQLFQQRVELFSRVLRLPLIFKFNCYVWNTDCCQLDNELRRPTLKLLNGIHRINGVVQIILQRLKFLFYYLYLH